MVNVWYMIAVMIVSMIVSYALRPTPQQPNPQTIEDLNIPTVKEGTPVAVVFGDVWVDSPQIVWYGALSTQPIKSSGGKK